MYLAEKGAKQIKIPEDLAGAYAARGYTIRQADNAAKVVHKARRTYTEDEYHAVARELDELKAAANKAEKKAANGEVKPHGGK